MTIRRLIPLLVALAMAFAPVSLEACEASCAAAASAAAIPVAHVAAGHDGHASASPQDAGAGHTCHHGESVTSAPGTAHIVGLPHTCGHSDDLPPTQRVAAQVTLHQPAVLAALFTSAPPVTTVRARTARAAPPGAIPIASPIPIRI